MLGVAPAEAGPELQYIVPSDANLAGVARVLQVVEKSAPARAGESLTRGALWNLFIIAASARALLDLYERRVVSVPDCGWTDLGTPQRAAETLHRLSTELSSAHLIPTVSSYLHLAFAHARLQRSSPATAA